MSLQPPVPPSWLEPQPAAELGLSGATLPQAGRLQQARHHHPAGHHPATYCSCSGKSWPLGMPPLRFSRRQGASSAAPRETCIRLHGPRSHVMPTCGGRHCAARLHHPVSPLPGPARPAGQAALPLSGPQQVQGHRAGCVPLLLHPCPELCKPPSRRPQLRVPDSAFNGHRAPIAPLWPWPAHAPLWSGDPWLCSLATGGRMPRGLGDRRAESPPTVIT